MICPYMVSVSSFVDRHEQQFSIPQLFSSLNYPDRISPGKICLCSGFPIDDAYVTSGRAYEI